MRRIRQWRIAGAILVVCVLLGVLLNWFLMDGLYDEQQLVGKWMLTGGDTYEEMVMLGMNASFEFKDGGDFELRVYGELADETGQGRWKAENDEITMTEDGALEPLTCQFKLL